MDRVLVQSTTLAEVGYDMATMTLEVAFHDGSVYQYFDVPETAFHEILHSESVGKFFNMQIKNSYRYTKL